MAEQKPKIGDRLREAREAKGWTRQELADKAGIPHGTLVRWELGHQSPRGDDIASLCDELDVTADWMLGRTEMPREIVPGFYLIDVAFVDALLATTDADKIEELCALRPGPVVDFGTVLTEGVQFIAPERARAIERRVMKHIASHAHAPLRKIFRNQISE